MLCDGCGRETRNITSICTECQGCRNLGYADSTDEYRGRVTNNPSRTAGMSYTEMQARADREGWPYND